MKRTMWKRSLTVAGAAAVLLVAILLAGCGGGGSSSNSETTAEAETQTAEAEGTGSGEGGGGSLEEAVATAKEEVAKFEDPSNFEYPMPTEPITPGKHKVAIISVGENNPSGKASTEYAEEAAKAMGWESATFDSEGEVAKYANYITQIAQSGEYSALIIESLDVSNFQSAVEEALNKGVAISCISACDLSGVLKDKITDTALNYEEQGEFVGAFILAHAKEEAPSVFAVKSEQFPANLQRGTGVEKYLAAKCPECTFEYGDDVQLEEIAEPGPPFWSGYLAAHPEGSAATDYVQTLGDAAGTAAQAKTEVQAGRSDITIQGFDSFPEFVQMLTEGEKWPVGTTTAGAYEFQAWAAMDLAARQVVKAKLWKGATELPTPLVTANNVEEFKDPQNFVPPAQENFKAEFTKLWGGN